MAPLPSSEVIFLFTYLEGSVKRWEQQPQAMATVLARQEEIIRAAAEANQGYVFQVLGEMLCLAFSDATDAAATAVAIQRDFLATNWGEEELQIKVALHSGAAEIRGDQYFAPQTLNRLSRILAITNPGQILLSADVADQLLDRLPQGVSLRDMGERKLRDIQPVRIYQLVAADLPQDFPPLRTLDARPSNLPAQASSFIGRQQEQLDVATLLRQRDTRLVTLLGPGGSGKTRLSIQVATNLLDEFDAGAFFIPLAAITDPALIPSAIAQALGLAERPDEPVLETLNSYLAERHMLLVLDNFEQIVAAAPLIAALLDAAPALKLLISSREPLHLPNEQEYQVPPLAMPDPERLPNLEQLTNYAAIQLFVQRAQAAQFDFALTPTNAPAVVEICARLDGLPLAIELAAARVRMLPPPEMLKRLDNRLALLTSTIRDRTTRQQSLRGMIDWSYDLLDEAEQLLFVRLAVFVGGCTVEAAEVICNANADLPIDVAAGLDSLADKSLLLTQPVPPPKDGEGLRFAMLETIREYALEKLNSQPDARYSLDQKTIKEYAQEKLSQSGEEGILRHAHATYYAGLSERAREELEGPEQNLWLDVLEQEHDNFRAAMSWALQQGDSNIALRLCIALHRFWYWRSHLREGYSWVTRILQLGGGAAAQRAAALVEAGELAYRMGNWRDSIPLLEEALSIQRELGDEMGIIGTLNNLANSLYDSGQYEAARKIYEECITINQRLNNQRGVAIALGNLGIIASDAHDYVEAQRLYEQALAIKYTIKATPQSIATSLGNLGFVQHALGELAAAHASYDKAFNIFATAKNPEGCVFIIEGLAMMAVGEGQPQRSLTLFAAAATIREEIGAPIPPADKEQIANAIAAARQQLGDNAEQVWARGRAMSFEQTIDYVIGDHSE